jgi:hypothetical protein
MWTDNDNNEMNSYELQYENDMIVMLCEMIARDHVNWGNE